MDYDKLTPKQKSGYTQHHDAKVRYGLQPRLCAFCSKSLPYEKRHNRFCNQRCAASQNNRGVARNPRTRSVVCANCGATKENRANKYCKGCSDSHIYNSITTLTLANVRTDRSRKMILLRERGHQCEICLLTEWRGKPIPLDLDHIDGNPDSNDADNLRLLCPNCHAQTDTYKGKGTRAGRYSRRKLTRRRRYANGESY